MMIPNNEIATRPSQAPETSERPAVPVIAREFVRPRLPEVGRIRLGEKDEAKGYPKKLSSFRFTSHDRPIIEAVAALYGGEVKPWNSEQGAQWQVVSETTSIKVIVPRAEFAFSQYFELWAGGGLCERRCDGYTELLTGDACVCGPNKGLENFCQKTTRLSVFLPSIPGIGLWRVESHGNAAAAEILGVVKLAEAYGAALIPGHLDIVNRGPRRIRDRKTGNPVTVRYVVPVLKLDEEIEVFAAEAQRQMTTRLGLPAMSERALEQTMKALRTAVFTRWPNSVDEPERSVRLAQLSRLLGRTVTTISNDHDLTEQEAIFLSNAVDQLPDGPEPAQITEADLSLNDRLIRQFGLSGENVDRMGEWMSGILHHQPKNIADLSRAEHDLLHSALDELQTASDSSLKAEGAQAGPEVTGVTVQGPADSSAGDDATPVRAQDRRSATPAESLSAGEAAISESNASLSTRALAEHTPDEGEGEAPDSATGEVREDRGGKAAVPPEPTPAHIPAHHAHVIPTPKPRRTKAPSVAEVRKAQKTAEATRKQTTVEHKNTPIQDMHPGFRKPFMEHFGGDIYEATAKVDEYVAVWTAAGRWPAEGNWAPWSPVLYQELADATFEAKP